MRLIALSLGPNKSRRQRERDTRNANLHVRESQQFVIDAGPRQHVGMDDLHPVDPRLATA